MKTLRWPWTKPAAPEADMPRLDDGATRALQRARADKKKAEEDLQEMHGLSESIRSHRQVNHFAPIIYEAMKRKRP
jgi:hypothetical protein